MEIKTMEDHATRDLMYLVRVSRIEVAQMQNEIAAYIVKRVGEHIAADFLEKHGSEVMAKLSPEAVAQMAIAEAGAAVNDTLKRKLPDKIIEVERQSEPVVYQRGIFGGLRRL